MASMRAKYSLESREARENGLVAQTPGTGRDVPGKARR